VVTAGSPGALVASPDTVTFGDIPVGQTASTSISLLNATSATVQIAQLNLSGQAFAISGQTNLPAKIAPGKAYNLNVRFNPADAGTATGNLIVTSGVSTSSKVVVGLNGTGITNTPASPALSGLSCVSVSMTGSGTTACTVTLSSGAASGGMSVSLSSSNPAAVAVPATVMVPANATTAGFTATVSWVGSGQLVNLKATSGKVSKSFAIWLNAAVPALSIDTTNVAFGNVVVNTSATQSVSLISIGTEPVTIKSAELAGAGFSLSGATFPATLNPGQTATLRVGFNPATTGVATGQVTVTSNSSTHSTAVISLSGTGITNTPAAPALSGLSCLNVSMTGSGTTACTVTLSSAAASGGMSVSLSSSNPAAVAAPTTVMVLANATTAGFTAAVSWVGSGQLVNLKATSGKVSKSFAIWLNAALPRLTISQTSLVFGSVVVNTAETQTVTLSSTGKAPLTINSAKLTGKEFQIAGPAFPLTLNPGQIVTLQIRFVPTAPGAASDRLTVTSNSSVNAAAVILLSGKGTAPNSFTYEGAPLVSVLNAANPSVPVSRDFFGQTILNLIRRWSGPATAFPSFPVSTLRLWDVVYWQMLETSGPQPSWTRMDQTLALAQQNGVTDFIFTLGRVPQWASTNSADPCTGGGDEPGSCDPPQINALDDFATNLVQRYCGKIKYYETWNEPNNTGYWNGTKAQLLTVAQHLYKIAKDPANCGCTNGACSPNGGANPNQVLMPSVSRLSEYNLDWLNSYLAEAGPEYQYADIASFHGYGATNPEEVADQVQQFRRTVAAFGMANLPLWNTEASWGDESSEVGQDQASWLMRYHVVQATIGVSRFVWYAYDNCNWGTLWSVSPCGNSQATHGLTAPGGAYAVIETWLTGANLSGCNQYKDGLWACELTRPGGYDAWMIWSATGTSISVPASDYIRLNVYRDWHNDVNLLPTSLVVDQMPVLLENHDL